MAAFNVKIVDNKGAEENIPPPPVAAFKVTVENPISAKVNLKARKTMDGNILIMDHPEIDIVLSPAQNKVLAFSKTQYGDHVYATQSRLFEHLAKNGVIDPSTIHGGNVFGSLEGKIMVPDKIKKIDPIQMTLYTVVSFLLEEKPHYLAVQKYKIDFEKELLDPDEQDSTELGEIPHGKRRGTINQMTGYPAQYGFFGRGGF
tara:strand:+ start:8331 stop:8936 length:606 start_codon:yes stop_codon:yes gene_type:complete